MGDAYDRAYHHCPGSPKMYRADFECVIVLLMNTYRYQYIPP
jgi:hypothetical protein